MNTIEFKNREIIEILSYYEFPREIIYKINDSYFYAYWVDENEDEGFDTWVYFQITENTKTQLLNQKITIYKAVEDSFIVNIIEEYFDNTLKNIKPVQFEQLPEFYKPRKELFVLEGWESLRRFLPEF